MPPTEEPQQPGILKQEAQGCASPSSYLGLVHDQSPRQTTTPKSVSIAPQAEVISPLMLGGHKNVDDLELDNGRSPKKTFRSPGSKRLSGRRPSFTSPFLRPNSALSKSDNQDDMASSASGQHLDHFIGQVAQWIKDERSKHAEKKATQRARVGSEADDKGSHATYFRPPFRRRGSDASEESPSFDKLEEIIKQSLERRPSRKASSMSLRHRGSLRKLSRKPSIVSSDTDYLEGDVLVTSCDVVLDNSKTLSYTGGASDDSDVSSSDEMQRRASYRDHDAWSKFKFEIVRVAHTLRLKGWRRVPMDLSGGITVQRLSGALTNAVYVVSPSADLLSCIEREDSNGTRPQTKKPPPKLLLRIYGPQVEHLIDREAELAILRRLARKRIGPRLLGTFSNGRFEEYLNAKPLTPEDLRHPDTSRQIAKRMRELHDGIELLSQERDDGAFVWRNWDKWVQRVERVVTWLDCQTTKLKPGAKPTRTQSWKRRGFICGVPWKQFRSMVEKYRAWLEEEYGGRDKIREQLVFAHNDTQYGNILRLMPSGDSPLLLPANTHKQLVVIDFEYSNANLPGLEFANHFTEWCYNYHDARKPYAFHTNLYPKPEEQDRFIRTYVRHRAQSNASTPKLAPTTPPVNATTPGEGLVRRPTSSISDFMLDARAPSSGSVPQVSEDAAQKAAEDQEVTRLMQETRMWRLANTAQWVAWGIVQAKVPGMPDFSDAAASGSGPEGEEKGREELGERGDEYRDLVEQKQGDESEKEEAEEEFDYLGYVQHRALFFWADAIQTGLVREEELPQELRSKVKTVPY